MKVALISCGKLKKRGRHKAKDLYSSPRFQSAFQYAVQNFDAVYVLSAKHGLLHPDTEIENYDMTLADASVDKRKEWTKKVAERLQETLPADTEVHLLCGEKYHEFLPETLPDMHWVTPLAGMRMGQQLQWLENKKKFSR